MRHLLIMAVSATLVGCPSPAASPMKDSKGPGGAVTGKVLGAGAGTTGREAEVLDQEKVKDELGDVLDAKVPDMEPTSDGARPPPPEPQEIGLAQIDMSDEAIASAVAPHVTAARTAADQGDWDRVITEARVALQLDGADVGAVLLLARAYYHKQWYTKAKAIVEQATAVSPGDGSAQLWMLRGLVAEAVGDGPSLAVDYYKEAVRLRPKYARAWTNLGAVLIATEQFGDAISALKTALSQDPDLVSAYTNLGTAYRRQAMRAKPNQRDELLTQAEEAYEAAIRTDETFAAAHLNLGILYLDTAPFPGKDDGDRLRAAVKSLTDYKNLTSSSGQTSGAEYLSAAQRELRAHVTAQKRGAQK